MSRKKGKKVYVISKKCLKSLCLKRYGNLEFGFFGDLEQIAVCFLVLFCLFFFSLGCQATSFWILKFHVSRLNFYVSSASWTLFYDISCCVILLIFCLQFIGSLDIRGSQWRAFVYHSLVVWFLLLEEAKKEENPL